MNRRNFINLSLLTSAASLIPLQSLFFFTEEISTQELLGKGSPELFGNGYKLRKAAYEDFIKMQQAAQADGIAIQIVSSYRSFDHQQRIWNGKYKRYTERGLTPTQAIHKIIDYSTIPGTSRHHWGTDIDIIDANPPTPSSLLQPKNYYGDSVYAPLKKWMDQNAKKFNFQLVYTKNEDRKGFKHEPWHFSYAPLSIPFLKKYQKLDIKNLLQNSNDILGSENFSEKFIQKYISENVLDINLTLLA